MLKSVYCRRSAIVVCSIFFGICLFEKCVDNKKSDSQQAAQGNFDQFAGSLTCARCHQHTYATHIHTAHFLTSQPATEENIKGSFDSGRNTFVFNSHTRIATEKRNDGLYQVLYIDGVEKRRRRFDITIGSATKGQTYLYWWKDTLFQLPLTYFTAAGQWSNSPGYPGRVIFGRPITSRCLECHTTYAYAMAEPGAQFEKFDHRIIYGVDCEKCHGPGRKHAEFQSAHPGDTTGKFIINPGSLSRMQNLNLCALCHGGRLSKTKPSFEFQAGDTLSNYFLMDTAMADPASIDAHGNQYGLLAASKCFRMSQMTCTSCHNPHENEAGKIALFSERCLSCHNGPSGHACKLTATIGPRIKQNCIDCHMPERSSKSITVLLQGETEPTAAVMRSHLIKIYPDETARMLESFKNNTVPAKKKRK